MQSQMPWHTASRLPAAPCISSIGVDTGPVLAQQAVSVKVDDTEESLHERIKSVERELLVEVVQRLCRHDVEVVGREVVIS